MCGRREVYIWMGVDSFLHGPADQKTKVVHRLSGQPGAGLKESDTHAYGSSHQISHRELSQGIGKKGIMEWLI